MRTLKRCSRYFFRRCKVTVSGQVFLTVEVLCEVLRTTLIRKFSIFKAKDPLKKYFPADEPATRKNPLYVKLFDGLDRVDGKPTEAERKVRSIPIKKYKQKETNESVLK